MRKLFTILSLVLLYVTIAFGQAAYDVQIMVHDAAGLSYPLWFGLDLTATDDIDAQLGESDLPPPPPGNAFDARWWIPPFDGSLSSWRDYRAPGDPPAFPFNGNKQHVIKFQSTDFPITISWSLPTTIANTSTIQDPFNIQVLPFYGTDSMVVTLSAIPYVQVSIDYSDATPVELTSFTAAVNNGAVELNWRTATETNNKGFEIERKQASTQWERIGYVEGNGTTTEPQTYTFKDNSVQTGSYYYRLKQIDFDGTFSYSKTVEAEINQTVTEYALFQNYPNPFNPTTAIKFQVPKISDVSVKIYDMLGSEVRSLFSGQVQEGIHAIVWDGLNNEGVQMSSGTYLYRITAGQFIQSKKMILLR
jgi:FlgD Ig-like domain